MVFGLNRFFHRLGKGDYSSLTPEKVLEELNKALRESEYDLRIAEELGDLIEDLENHIKSKEGFKQSFSDALNNPSPAHSFREELRHYFQLQAALVSFSQKREGNQVKIKAAIYGETKRRINKIKRRFGTFNDIIGKNWDFFEKLQLPSFVVNTTKIIGSLKRLKGYIQREKSLVDSLSAAERHFESLIEEERHLLSNTLGRLFRLKRGVEQKLEFETRLDLYQTREVLREMLSEFEKSLGKQRKEVDAIEAAVREMLEVFSEMYRLFLYIRKQTRNFLDLSRSLGVIYYPCTDITAPLTDEAMLDRFMRLGNALKYTASFAQLQKEAGCSRGEEFKKILLNVVSRILNEEITMQSFLYKEIRRMEEDYITTERHQNYIDLESLRFHYSKFLGKKINRRTIDEMNPQNMNYFEAISVYFFLSYDPNLRYFITPGNILTEQTPIGGRLYLNYPLLALMFYIQKDKAGDYTRVVNGAKPA